MAQCTAQYSTVDVPVFVGWCADDPIAEGYRADEWRALARVQSNPARLVINTPASGGHVVSEEYAAPIAAFLATAVP
jgi:hypothetical protein